jgi:hypothetical protein
LWDQIGFALGVFGHVARQERARGDESSQKGARHTYLIRRHRARFVAASVYFRQERYCTCVVYTERCSS